MPATRRQRIEAMLVDDPQDAFLRYSLALELDKEAEHERSLTLLADLGRDQPPYVPAFFMAGTKDLAFNMMGGTDPIEIMRRHVTDLQVAEVLEGCGHWTQQERPAEVNALLIPWLKGL